MWGKKRIKGTVYDLTHLDPFILDVPRPSGAQIRLQVQFGSHTFTEKYTALHTRDLAIADGNQLRAFCLNRYGHSLSLPAAVVGAVGGQACHDRGRMLINAALPGLVGPYLIAFTIRPRPAKKFDGVMMVVSAHHRPNLNPALPKAPFNAVVAATLDGRKIKWK
jgi:hypothetical protein